MPTCAPTVADTQASATGLTAGDVLFPAAADGDLLAALTYSGALDSAEQQLGAVEGAVLRGARAEVAGMAADFLDLDVAAVAVAGWRTCRELLEAADRTRGSRTTAVVPLGSRTISLEQHPSIDLVLGATTVPAIRFALTVEIEVQGAGRVHDGALVAIEGGRMEVTVTFSAEDHRLAKRTTVLDPHLALPLGTGLRLGHAHAVERAYTMSSTVR